MSNASRIFDRATVYRLPSGRLVRWIRTREDEAGGTVAEFVMVEDMLRPPVLTNSKLRLALSIRAWYMVAPAIGGAFA